MTSSSMEATLHQVLSAAFNPDSLIIENESHLHAGHAGSPGTGDSHFSVTIVSRDFENLTRLARHREVMAILENSFSQNLHAITLSLKAPSELSDTGTS